MARSISKNGFTLIELMIVVAIIGILASVAVPAYINHFSRVRQAEGTQKLLDLKASQERFYGLYDQYATSATSATFSPLLSFDPADTEYHLVSITAGGTTNFTARAEGDYNGDGDRSDCWTITSQAAQPLQDVVTPCYNDEGFSFSIIGSIFD